MEALKRLASITLITIILLTGFIQLENKSYFVFADSATDQWETVTTNEELAEAFRYYCKSRNLTIDGSVLDALTKFTTNTFNTICNTLGIDVTALQAHLKRSTDSNGKIQFLFDEFGVTAYNRIFAEFLQNNDLEVGDEVEDQDLYYGGLFTDDDGNSCLVYYISDFSTSDVGVEAEGTPYLGVNGPSLVNNASFGSEQLCYSHTSNIGGESFDVHFYDSFVGYYYKDIYFEKVSNSRYGTIYSYYENGNNKRLLSNGCLAIIFDTTKNILSLGTFSYYYQNYNSQSRNKNVFRKYTITNKGDFDQDINVFITTNNNTINNNTYNDNKQTVINNDGDVYNYDYDDDDPPINPPSGGGGDNPPSGGSPSDWGVELPNLDINWILAGKENKFPFDIPFNIMFALSLLNAEPEAPHFEGTINFGFTSYEYDIDFIQFDPVAVIFRRLMFLAFIFGLMFLTKQLIWG